MAQIEPTWLKNPATGALLLVAHDDTLKRVLAEGYLCVPPPGSEPEPEAAIAAAPLPEAIAAVQSAQAQALVERNDAARKAFAVEPPAQSSQRESARPGSAVRGKVRATPEA